MGVNRLVMHVERVVLHGFARQDEEAFREAFRAELAILVGRNPKVGALSSLGRASRLSIDGPRIPRDLRPEQAGAWVAKAIARGLGS
jgi:hypothetical protein